MPAEGRDGEKKQSGLSAPVFGMGVLVFWQKSPEQSLTAPGPAWPGLALCGGSAPILDRMASTAVGLALLLWFAGPLDGKELHSFMVAFPASAL